MRLLVLAPALLCLSLAWWTVEPARADDPGVELFENRIRPVLVEQCYQCHNSIDKSEGGLTLDDRAGLLEGGDSGPAILPGKPDESPLIRAVRHVGKGPKMPKEGPRLPDAVVADFVKWVQMGAPDPRDRPPAAAEIARLGTWESVREQRKRWWCFQPIARPKAPEVRDKGWSDHPIDRFILARLEQERLQPNGLADRRTLLRRVTFALTGLPPSPEEMERFLGDGSPTAYESVVDRLLSSPRFGERWARHWMDWFRYAESHGSEGDPAIPYAWRYRDYLIRALNEDVPYPRLIREHLAGDLLPAPRMNREQQINESALGAAHLRMVAHGYSPTDALDEQVTFTDNQIDVLSKAVLGLTVACARCHNHKFDAISQTDFYALYGVMASARPALITIDSPERAALHRSDLEHRKRELRGRLADAWTTAIETRRDQPSPLDPSALAEAAKDPTHPLHAWAVLRNLDGEAFARGWARLVAARSATKQPVPSLRWDLSGDDYRSWFQHGNGLAPQPSRAGEFHILAEGEKVVANVYQAGVYSHRLSTKHNGMLTSPRFRIDTDAVSVKVAGGNGARVRLVVQNYPRAIPLIYKANDLDGEDVRWVRWDTRYWKGDWAYIEIATAGDLPVEARTDADRSWFGITEVVAHGTDWTPEPTSAWPKTFSQARPGSRDELATLYATTLRQAVAAWKTETATDDQARFLGALVRAGAVPNTLESLPGAAPIVAEYRRLEARVPVPRRAPGVIDGTPFEQPLFERGDHKNPKQPVERRFLEVFNGVPYRPVGSGRVELGNSLADMSNPLVPRVLVNRLWHHLFGRGIVATTDNFGRMGDLPTHPELLDDLAARFRDGGGSIKTLIRLIVTSKTYRLSSRPSAVADEHDPVNQWLSHFPVHRLEAESLRDAILAVAGRLDETRYGPEVSGKGRRRSLYVRVHRNDLDPFLNTFDAPEPVSTRGRRDTTNVPAQSLTLLNDPWVREQAGAWAERLAADPSCTDDEARIRSIFLTALGRKPTAEEINLCRCFLDDQDQRRNAARPEDAGRPDPIRRWRDLVHAVLNFKEFLYIR